MTTPDGVSYEDMTLEEAEAELKRLQQTVEAARLSLRQLWPVLSERRYEADLAEQRERALAEQRRREAEQAAREAEAAQRAAEEAAKIAAAKAAALSTTEA